MTRAPVIFMSVFVSNPLRAWTLDRTWLGCHTHIGQANDLQALGKSHAMSNARLYQDLARKLVAAIISGQYPVGSRLPAERELAQIYDVSRPTVREAIIALEVRGFVEVRIGSGAYVMRLPGDSDIPGFGMSAFELTEARYYIEGEAAALAASHIDDTELATIAALVEDIARENNNPRGTERADRAFHLAIAQATRNAAMLGAVTSLWDLRDSSAEAALLHAKARSANVKPVVAEHTAVLEALRARDPDAARTAMRAHLAQVLESLLFATGDETGSEAGALSAARRARYAPASL
jgi:GntR family transcriptional regulator, hexuronate regulon transcriptional repressor